MEETFVGDGVPDVPAAWGTNSLKPDAQWYVTLRGVENTAPYGLFFVILGDCAGAVGVQ